jgi:hypothetical protein
MHADKLHPTLDADLFYEVSHQTVDTASYISTVSADAWD